MRGNFGIGHRVASSCDWWKVTSPSGDPWGLARPRLKSTVCWWWQRHLLVWLEDLKVVCPLDLSLSATRWFIDVIVWVTLLHRVCGCLFEQGYAHRIRCIPRWNCSVSFSLLYLILTLSFSPGWFSSNSYILFHTKVLTASLLNLCFAYVEIIF